MKITRRPPVDALSPRDLMTPTVPVAPPASATAGDGGDRVELSEAARLRQRLRSEMGDARAIDAQRVADLRARLANDAYHPTPQMVAERLLAELAADLLL